MSDRTNMYSTVSVVQTDRPNNVPSQQLCTLSALGKCEKSLNLENGSPILGVGLMRGFSSQNWAKVQFFFKVAQAGPTNPRDISDSITVTPLLVDQPVSV